jgi:hypothetical protein
LLLLSMLSSMLSLLLLSSSFSASKVGVDISGTTVKLYGTENIAFPNWIDGNANTAGGGTRGGGAGSDGSKQSLSNVMGCIGGGSYYAARGINFSLFEDLVEGMKSTFRVVQG